MDPAPQEKYGYRRAASTFKASVSVGLAERFAQDDSTLASLKDEIKKIQDDHGRKGSLRNLTRVRAFIEAMNQLGQVIEVFVNANDLVCFIWGPMKFLLGVAKSHLDTFDKLLDVYAQIGDVIPGLLFYRDMFMQHEPLRGVLQDYYSDILKFHEEAIRVFARSKWKDFFHATWKTFNTRFDPIMQSLTKRRELLESVKASASLDQIHILRRDISDVYREQIRAADEQMNERHRFRMALIKEKLCAPDYFRDQEVAAQRRERADSGQWVLTNPHFVSWSDTKALEHSVLYINGIPGAGKTTLASMIISTLLKDHASKEPPPISVSYFYFKHNDRMKDNHEGALRAILTQLIDQDTTSSQEFLEDLTSQADVNIRSRGSLEVLTKRALEEFRISYLVFDGLDECAQEQAEHTVNWILSLLDDSRYVRKNSLRIIFSGQRDGLLDKALSEFPSIRLESSKHHADIERYCVQYGTKLQKKFRLNKEQETHIVSLVSKGAQGMFLYARVVLEYLFRQVSLSGLMNAIKPEIFPSKLETAYQRVAATIFDAEFESEMDAAKKIISLVITAKRDLRWREIQSFFCIDSEKGIIDPHERLVVDAKRLCGSLIDVHQVDGRTSEPESVIRIVHYTAQRYLVEKKLIDDSLQNARLLSFCASYLLSPPFYQSNRSDEISSHARRAYYSLQDYAVAHWYGHLESLEDTDIADHAHTPEVTQALQMATRSTQYFLAEYDVSFEITDINIDRMSPQAVVKKLPSDHRDRNSLLNIGQRTCWIRQEIENLGIKDLQEDEKDILDNFYGPLLCYKCPRPDCVMFSDGFATIQERDTHVNHHERPFLCIYEDCFGKELGFESQASRNRHTEEYHTEPPTVFQFPILGVQDQHYGDRVWAAAKAGDICSVRYLLDKGANINIPEEGDKTPLWIAASRGDYEMCKLLIHRGASIEKTPSKRDLGPSLAKLSVGAPLTIASVNGHLRVVDLLLKTHAATDTLNDSALRVALGKAVIKDHDAIVQLLLSCYDFRKHKHRVMDQGNPLREACSRGNVVLAQLLLQNGFKSLADETCIVRNKTDWENQRVIWDLVLSNGDFEFKKRSLVDDAIRSSQPSAALLLLSYPRTNLSAQQLRELRSLAEKHSYLEIVQLIEKLLECKKIDITIQRQNLTSLSLFRSSRFQ